MNGDAFQKEIVHELGCKPCGEVAAIRALKAQVAELEKVETTYHELRNALFEMTHETDTRTIDQLVNGDLAIAAAVALMKWPIDQSGKGGL